jgi:tetratricopeptide (TPR) repeat protein
MHIRTSSTLAAFLSFAALSTATQTLPDVPEGVQAMSLLGKPLRSSEPSPKAVADFEAAKATYEKDRGNADNIIWYGRRAGYLGDYREAIRIFSEGIEKHPDDARMYRHRGHRYISIREFDRAIADLERAVKLIEGRENEVEPDGAPNAQNIPVSTLHGSVWYHLGLAYYLKHDWANALRAYQNGFDAGRNDDNRVSTTHWRFSILRRMGKPDEARKVLDAITADMNIIENTSYHRLCLFYKGELEVEDILPENDDDPANAAIAYGVANWYLTEGNDARAREMMEKLVASSGWAGFGVIAAEADLAAW